MVNLFAGSIYKLALSLSAELRRATAQTASILLILLVNFLPVNAATTGQWTPTGTTGGTATAAGITVTVGGVTSTNAAVGGATSVLNATSFWSNPYTGGAPSGGPSLTVQPNPYGTNQTITITFSKPVDNPVVHFDRLGGSIGTSASTSLWTFNSATSTFTGSSVTPTLLGGSNVVFKFTSAPYTWQRDPVPAITGGSECLANNTATACGSVQFVGTGITKLSFDVTWAGTSNTATGDGLELAVSLPDPSLTLKKTVTNNNGGTLAASSVVLTATGPSTITGASGSVAVTNATAPAGTYVLTEANPAGYLAGAWSCTSGTLTGNSLVIVSGQSPTCTINNDDISPTLTLTKISNGGAGPFTFTGNNGWTSQTITTVTSGTAVSGLKQTLTSGAVSTIITEAIPAGYILVSATCSGLGSGGTATPNLVAGTLTLDAAATAIGSDIACTYTNTKLPTITLTKISNGAVGGFTFTGTNGWTSQTITTTVSGTGVVGATQALTAAATATTITEAIPAGYVLASATCSGLGTGGTATPNLATGTVALDSAATAAGSNIACTFTNTKLPTIVVTKNSVGGVGPFNFTGTNGYPGQTVTTITSGVNASGPAVTLTAANTLTRITEAIPAGYVLSNIACTGTGAGNTTNNLASGFVDIAVGGTAPGATVNCTFTNTKKPTVTLTKISNGGVGPYTFTGTNGWTSQTITTTVAGTGVAGATQTLTAPSTATTITEGIPAGYALTNASCTGLGTGGTAVPNLATGALALDAAATAGGSNISCTFTNAKLPTVTLTKISNGGVGPYTFTGTNGWTSQTITTTTAGTGVAGAAQTLTATSTATTLTEAIPAGYALTGATCTGLGTGGTAVPNFATGALALDAAATAPGSNIACTFTNAKLPTVTLTKISNGGVGPFTFTGDNGWTSQTITTTASGTGVVGALQTLNSPAVTTTITEAIPVGYALASTSCTGLGSGGTATPNLATGALVLDAAATAAGSNIACTFTNTKLPTVTLTKISNGGVGPFTFTGNNGWTSQTITTATAGTGVAGVTQILATPSTATTITEGIPSGYVLASATCSGLGSGGTATPNLATGAVAFDTAATAAGSAINCTFTNNKLPTLTLAKTVTNDNGGTVALSSVTLTATGPTTITGVTAAGAVTNAQVPLGTYALTEANPTGYLAGAWSCSAGTLTGNSLVLAAGQNATCTINDNDISPILTLIKAVTNDNGGTLAANTVVLTATGPTAITGVTAAPTVTNAAVNAGTYTLTEASTPGYAQGAWSCTAGTLTGNSLVLVPGQNSTCTINNNDISPTLTLVKTVTNDNGGALAVNTVTLTAAGPTPISGVTAAAAVTNANVSAGTYTLSETATPGYTQGAWSCSAGTLTGSSLVLAPGQNATCTINNNDNGPVLTLVKTITNDNGGAVAANTVSLSASGPVSIAGVTGAGAVTSATVSAGTYTLSEANPAGYAAGAWSCTAGTLTGSSLVLALGQTSTCTINDNDISPVLSLVKTVTNDNGGTILASSVNLTATGPTTITGASGAPAVTNAAVNPGTYTLTEVNPSGYTAGAWSCTAGTLTGNSLVLALGQTASCTINDNDISPTLTLVKTVTNDDGGPLVANTVNLTATGPTTIIGVTGNAAVTSASVNAGIYALTEASVPGYTAGAWSCTAGTLSGSNLTLTPGQNATCTINNNDIAPKLTLAKTVTNDDGGTSAATAFTLTAAGPVTITGATGAAPVTSANVKVGTYALSETGPAGYAAGAWSCTAGTLAGSNLTLAAGQVATCTINNNDVAPILTLVKTVTNDNGGTVAANTVSLSAVGPVSVAGVSGAPAVTSATVKSGVYALSEANPAGYTAGSWSCTAGTLAGSSLTLANGQTAICTINDNDISPVLTLAKTLTNDNGGTAVVSSFTLTAAGPTPVSGTSGSAAVTSASVNAGVYALSETGPAGYTASAWSCSAGTLAGSNLTLAPGQTAVCSIDNNDDPAKLTLVKTVTNDNGGINVVADFTLKATGPTTITGLTTAASVTNATVNAGTYALSETGPAGYSASAWSCSAGTLTGSSLALGSGQNATCTLSNNDISPKLTLVKTVTNDNGGASVVPDFALAATGPTPITGITGAAAVTNANVNVGTYTLTESGPTGYTAGAWSCTAGTLTGNSLVLALNQSATCTINNNDISPKLTLVKTVTNDSGGSSVVADFTLKATGPTTITGMTSSASVTNANVNVGTYALSETGPSGYTAGAWSCDAGTLSGSNLTLALNQSATCTLNNNDTPATITLNKISNGATGAFVFNGTNGFGTAQTITTTVSGASVSGATRTLAASSTPTIITETIPTGFGLTAASCTGIGSGTATPNLLTGALALDAAATAPGNTINCTFTNGVASFTVAKSADISNIITPGPITYTITVANTGQADLTSPTLVDNLTQGGSPKALSTGPTLTSGDAAFPGVLNVGETWIYQAIYNVTQVDIDGGGTFSNTATFDTQQTNPSVSAPAVTTVSQLPKLSVTKSSPTTSFATVNDPISYSYLVRNTGNVTVTNAITIVDNKTTVSCPPLTGGILAPNDTITCTASYLATQADIDAGGVTNTATANTLFGGNPVASLPVNKFVPAVQSPGLSVVKSSPSFTFINPGDIVNYEYFVRNTGNTTLNAPFTVNDNLVTVTCPATPTTLVPGAQGSPGNDITCTANHVVTQDDLFLGSVTNLASATSGTTTSPQTSKTIPPTATPALSITKDTVPPGVTFNTLNQVVTYTYTVQNSGGATLTRAIDVYDDKIAGAISCWTPTVGDPNFTPGTPAPNGETATCTANYTVTQADLDLGYVTNQAYAQTTFGVGNIVVTSPPAPKTTNAVQAPQLKVTKSVLPDPVVGLALGQSLTYAIDVQNIGNITVSNINVTDPLIPALGCNIASLAPTIHNAVNSCTGTYIVTQADVDAGNIHNTASASGVTPQGAPVLPIATGSKDTAIPQVKTMSVAKALSSNADQDSSSSITLGDTLTYSVTATNTGTVTQTGVHVTDSKITPASKICSTLAPNATCILTGTYTVTQADVDAGTIGNTGTLTSDIITAPQTSVVNTPVAQLSKLTTLKTKTGFTDNDANTILTVGDTLHYTVTATNSGTVTQNAVTVSDPLLTPNSNTCNPLSVGAVCTLTGDHIVTTAEATAGVVNNTGSATSTLITTPVTSLVSTPVTRIITAVTDAPASVNGATGAPSLVNAYANDTLNGFAATPSNITGTVLSPATPIAGGPVPTLDVATGIVSVPPGTPAGPYTINYQICEIANPTNCSTANINVTVTAAPVVATGDTVTGINGASGATAVTSAFNGDTINGNPATPSNSILTANTAVPPQLAFDPTTGSVDVLPGTPAGTYTFDYKICEKLNPTNCKIATISVTVDAAPLVATNDTPPPVNGATGNPSLVDAYANDTLNGVPVSLGTINGTVVTPAVPIGGKPVPVLDPATGLVSVPAGTPAGTYTITYQICEQLNPISNCKTALVTVNVTAAPLVAANDSPAPVNGATGNANLTNAFTNDTLNGVPTTPATTTASIITPATPIGGGPVPALNPATGNVAVPAGTPAGSYTITYEVCENLNPTNCKQATVNVVVEVAPIVATNDTPANVNGATGNPTLVNAFANDTLNGVAVVPANINASVVTPATPIAGGPVPTFNAATGNVAVPAGTPAGTYVITYKICEKLNPTNCSTADVTVVVDPAPIVAVADTPAAVNGATGNANIVNAYANDTLNGVPVTLSNITGTVLSPATPLTFGASVPALDPATGFVSVPAGTPAGSYTISYQICENLNPTNCATSTVTVNVTAAPILAVADAPASVNGKTGNANLVDAYANDTLNGVPVTLAKITGTVLAPATPVTTGANVPLLDPATGTVSVPAETPAGTYTIDYKICEKLNPSNCSTATVTVVVDAAVIAALPDTPAAINGVNGGITATVLQNDALNSVAVVPSEINLTPGTAPTPAAGAITMNADGTITVAPGTTAGSYPYSYTICEKLNPLNCSSATATVVVAAAPILANADTPPNVNGASGNPSLVDAYANDILNGVPVTLATITGSVTIPATPIGGGPVPMLNPATGVVSVPAGTPAGPYTITYKICENLNPTNCSSSTVTVNVDAAPVVATNDTASGVNGANGATAVVNALTGDTINGNPASAANSTLTANTAVPPQLAFDPATGIVDVVPGTPAGTYTFDYKLCEILNPTNCKIASISIDVIAAPILATNDTPASVNGATGNPSLVNAYSNDQLNGAAATPTNITGSVLTPATPVSVGAPVPVLDTATGVVSVPAGTPAGSYSIGYKICEQLNLLNCSTATIFVVVTAAPIVATNDFTPALNGLVGNPSLDNAYSNDLLNGVAVVPANIIGSVLTPATPVTVGAPVPVLNATTGNISVPAGTPAGSYVIHYQICEKLNPTNCAVADITVPVDAAQIVALNDTPASVNGVNGNPSLTNAFTNDTLNGLAVIPANILGSVLIPATPAIAGAPVPALDPVTGNVAVPANTPAGTYTIHYQICEKLNPSNCAVADVIVVIDPSPIVATNDTATGINGASGAANVTNAFTADTINGLAATPSNAALSVAIGSTVPPQLTFDTATGDVSVLSGTPVGTYTFDYQICEILNPTNCKTATETVTVVAALIAANPDTPPSVNGATGNPSLVNAYTNDLLNGVPVTPSTITGTVLTPATPATFGAPVPALDPTTGYVAVPPNTPAGTYTITYQICENLNPANCSFSSVTVVVDPSPIIATSDTVTGINGAVGSPLALNVFTGDTVNSAAAATTNAILSVATGSTVPTGLTFNTSTGDVAVDPGTPAGSYTFDYQICELINPTNCKTASVTVGVIAAPLLAANDTASNVNGASGATAVVNAFAGDTLNSAPATAANSTLTVATGSTVPTGLTFNATTGDVEVVAGTPAGSYSFDYQICEILNPSNCKIATITVAVVAAPVVATNDTVTGINGASGATAVTNAFNGDLINGVTATSANSVLTLATGFTVPTQLVFDPSTGAVDVKPGTPIGTYTFDYQICEILNPTNCKMATVSVGVVAAPVVATPDTVSAINGTSGATAVLNAFSADTINGAPATTANAVLSVATGSTVPSQLVFNPATGTVDVKPNTPAGAYTFNYQICEMLNPLNCQIAAITVNVVGGPVLAVNDSASGVNGASGATAVVNAFAGDTINGVTATAANSTITLAVGFTVPPELVFNPATGDVDVLAGTPVGTYAFDYTICENLNPTNCATATVSVLVGTAVIAANPDTPPSVNGATGNPTLTNAFTNDTLNSVAVVPSKVNTTVTTAATPRSVGEPVPALDTTTGVVSVPAGTPAGTYTIAYEICEKLNPTNCANSIVTVVVDPAPVVATADTISSVNGANGATAALNAFTADSINGAPATPANSTIVLATASTVPPQLVFTPATGGVDVLPNTPIGTYTFDYKLCEILNPTNCKIATETVNVIAAPLVAANDTPPNVNGATGNPTLINAFTNDSFNSAPVDLAKVTATVTTPAVPATAGAPVPALDPSTGNVSVPPGTPAGTYTITYQLCENLNPIANCKTAIVTVLVDAAPVVATADTATGINGASGASAVVNALTADTINGAPATTANSILSVATGSTVPPQLVFDPTTGNVDVKPGTPAGTYTFDYQICEKLNPTNCKTATISVTTVASPLVAVADTATGINGASGATAVTNALNGDLINGVAATPANAILSVATGSTVPPQLVFNSVTGAVDVLPGTPAGTYTFDYQICEALNPTNCTTATISVTTIGSPVVATADTATGINGATGATGVTNALNGDLINGVAATPTNSVLSVATGSTVPPQLVFNPATGAVDVKPGTPAGTYTFDYQICEALNPTNCKIATISVTTVPSPLLAVNDTATGINSATGATAVTNALNGDLINGFAATTANSILSVATGSTVPPQLVFNPATGAVDVVAGTPAGTYTFDYQICETLNPTNCTTATISVTTIASPIIATADSATGINGASGATAVVNALNGDLINGVAATTANSILSVATGSTVPPQLVFNPATGAVDVVAGTPAGTYTFDYQICETLNPTNCKTATISVTTLASPIVATPDTVAGINGASGATAVINALNGDSINGAPATTTNSILSVATGSTVPPQLVFDPTTGNVDVTPGAPAGTYTFDYQICETLNPTNCKTATISVSTIASPVVATADTATGINGASGAPAVVNALSGDSINGAPATITNAILSVATGSTVPPQLNFNPATGAVDVNPGTAAGTYTFDYQICEALNPTNCKTATVSVTTVVSPVVATADTVGGIIGTTGATGVTNALNGDLINGVAATPTNSILTVATGSTVPPQLVFNAATGAVDVKPGTPAGTYTFDYQICEALNPTNCKTATISVTTVPSAIIAMSDTALGVNGATGALAATNAFNGDLINGAAATPANAVLTVATGSTVPPQLTFNPATGSVDVNPGTPAGTYTFDYQICETINPTNCKTATVSVTVVPPVIAAAPDSPATVFDTKNAIIGAVNVLTNDTLNGVQATPATVIITPVGALPPGVTLNADGTVDLAQYLASGTYTFDYQICDILNPTNCKTATTTIKVKKTVPAVSGTVFFDTNGNGVQDGGESVLPGYTVELVLNGVVVDTTLTATDGTYSIFGFPPAAGYKLIFKNPSGISVGAITGLDFTNSTILTNQNQPIDPSGVIYNSVTGAPVAGAVVTMTNASGTLLPAACLLPNQQTQTTTANGQYRFDILAGGAPECPVGQTEYRIVVVSPVNYLPAPSTNIAPQGSPLDANACAVAPAACLVSPSAVPPPVATPAPYYLAFLLQTGSPNVINNHIPLDPILAGTATFTKTALKTEVHRGERVPYVIQATAMNFTKANVVDIVPPGFDYVPGSALVNGVVATPTISGNQLTFTNITATGGALKVELTLIANAAVQPGPATNKAQLINFLSGALVSNARATVTVIADPVFDCGEIIGRVFEDANRNGYQDEGEKGLPGVRIATVKGLLVTTDKFGRFHVACADMPDHDIGSNFVMKLDTRTLPSGYRLTTENPRDVRLTSGKMTKLNFGASIAHLVDLDLNGQVFKSGSSELLPEWRAGLGTLIAKLDEEPSTLRLTYHTGSEPAALASKRLTAVSTLITNMWSKVDGRYKLPIETRSVDAKGGAQ